MVGTRYRLCMFEKGALASYKLSFEGNPICTACQFESRTAKAWATEKCEENTNNMALSQVGNRQTGCLFQHRKWLDHFIICRTLRAKSQGTSCASAVMKRGADEHIKMCAAPCEQPYMPSNACGIRSYMKRTTTETYALARSWH
eukprot:scaffold116_cov334-Pavlova_lutheri.AAC.6